VKIQISIATADPWEARFNPENPFSKETVREFVERHRLPVVNGYIKLFHGTPTRGKWRTNLTELREGSFLATNPTDAAFYAARDRGIKTTSTRVHTVWLLPNELGYCGHYMTRCVVPLNRHISE